MKKTACFALMAAMLPLWGLADVLLQRSGAGEGNLQEITARPFPARSGLRSAAMELPASFPLSTQDDINACSTIDANNDGKTWKYDAYAGGGGAACYEGMGSTAPADDYLVMGPVNFNAASGSYTLSLQAKKLYRAETFEVCLSATGTAADAVSIFSCSDVPNDFTPMGGDFSVAPGVYYVMVHCTSPSAGISLYVRNLQITAAVARNFTVPFSMVPEAEEARFYGFIDSNDDGKTWFYDTSNNGMAYNYSIDNAADDWLLFPEIEIPQAGNYLFSFDAKTWGTNTEALAVAFGQGEDPTLMPVVFADNSVGKDEYRRQVVVAVDAPGLYRPAIHCVSPANRGKLLVRNFSLEATDLPLPRHLPADFAGSLTLGSAEAQYTPAFILPDNARVEISMKVSGDAVAVAMCNAPADAAARPLFTLDASAEPVSASRVINVEEGGIRYLRLSTEGSARVSDISLRIVSEGSVYALPFSMQPTAEEFNEFQTVNSNADDAFWSYYEPFGAVRYNYSVQNDADDWLILPAVNIPSAGEMISVAMNVRGMSTKHPETFEVWEGETDDISAMRKIYSSPDILTETFTPLEFTFAPVHTGKTFIAVKATSKKNAFHLFLRDFSVKTDSRTTAVPVPVGDLAAAGAPMGSTEATVSFTLPSFSEAGNLLDPATELEATVATAAATKTLRGLPGSKQTCDIENGQGWGTVTVTVANAAGASNTASVRVYTGQDTPRAPHNIRAVCSEDNRSMTLTWEQTSEGANGGYADPALMTFVIRHSSGGSSYAKVAEVKGEMTYTYSIPESYPLEMHYLSVTPVNVAGQCDATSGKGLVLGKPYAIPAMEEFEGGEMTLRPLAMDKPDARYTLDWYFENPAEALEEAANASGKALIAFTQEEGAARGCLHLPKFDTRGDNGARLVVRLYNHPHFAPTRVSALTAAGSVAIGEILPAATAGWQIYSLPLPESLLGLQWIEPVLDFGFDGTADDEIWMLDAYGMEHYHDRELTLRANAVHSRMTAQKETVWAFTAANYGREPMTLEIPQLNFTTLAGEVLSFSEATHGTASALLQPGNLLPLTYNVTLDASMEGDLYYDITLQAEGDAEPANNTLFGETFLKVQDEYVVRDLAASRADGSDRVTLSWSAPYADKGMLDCENLEPWDYSASLGLFTNIDADGQRTIGFSIASFPGMNDAKAWQVWDYEESGFNDVAFYGYLGSARSLIVFSPYDYTARADDWLISPEVKGGTEVSFFVRPLSFAYGRESLGLYASSTGANPADFTLVSTFLTKEGEADKVPYWEEVTFTLPADARHFAIRYTSKDIFGLQLDNLRYTPAQPDPSALTYTVMRNGETVATGVSALTYTDDFPGEATYYVAAEKNYAGLHPLSNRAEVAENSGIGSAAADASGISVAVTPGLLTVTIPSPAPGSTLSVAAPDGRVLFSGRASARTEIPLPAGVCLLSLPDGSVRKLLIP